MKKTLSNIFVLILLLITTTTTVAGANTHLVCTESACSGFNGPLISESNIAPGDKATSLVTVTNNREDTLQIDIEFSGNSSPESFHDVIDVTIADSETVYYTSKFSSLILQQTLSLGTISPSESNTYEITLSLPNSTSNDYQSAYSTFDISLLIVGANGETVALSNNSDNSSSSSTNSSNVVGQVLGASTESSLIGQVLGLSNTSSDTNVLLGIEIILVGIILILRMYRKKLISSRTITN